MADTPGVRVESRRMKMLRQAFFDEGRIQSTDPDPTVRELSYCWLCREPIDYLLAPGSEPDAHELDHYVTVHADASLQEDPDNFRHSHRRCNRHRGKNAPSLGLGEAVPRWW